MESTSASDSVFMILTTAPNINLFNNLNEVCSILTQIGRRFAENLPDYSVNFICYNNLRALEIVWKSDLIASDNVKRYNLGRTYLFDNLFCFVRAFRHSSLFFLKSASFSNRFLIDIIPK